MKKYLLILLSFISLNNISAKEWNVAAYGAKGDSITLNTSYIQKAIDECSLAGGGTVMLKDGIFLSGTILLKNNVNLHIADNAQLIGSADPADYKTIDPFVDAVGQERGKCLIGAMDAKNISITGSGIINGRGHNFKAEYLVKLLESKGLDKSNVKSIASNRPFLLRFVRCSNITLKAVSLKQSAAWTCHFFQCSVVMVDGITIYNHCNQNNDGIDIDSSNKVVIKNSSIDAADDAVCFKSTSPMPCFDIKVFNCKIKSEWGALKIGTESMGDFHDIKIKNCSIYDTRGGGIKLLSVDGGKINNILIENITMDNVEMPIFIRLGERLRTYRDAPKQEVGVINNVTIRNVKATTRSCENSRVNPPTGVFITGTPNHKIGAISLKNIEIKLPGTGTEEQSKIIVEEQLTKYPEFNFFGVLPAFGMMVRHVENLSVENMSVITMKPDFRKDVLFEDVASKTVKNLSINNAQ